MFTANQVILLVILSIEDDRLQGRQFPSEALDDIADTHRKHKHVRTN